MQILIAVLVGSVAGVVAALCGVGGGVVMVPAFVYLLHLGQKTAVATSLVAIIFTALATSAKNQANGLVDWKIAISAGLAGALVGWFAADWLKKLQDETLTRIFASVIIIFGAAMWLQSTNKKPLFKSESSALPAENQKN